MKKNITFLFLFLTAFTSFSQDKVKGNGVISMVETKIDGFKKIILNNDFEVTLIKAESPRVEIETDENLHEEIEFGVIDSVLTIETSTKLRPKKTLDVTIFCTDALNEIELNDESGITSLRNIYADNLLLTINDKSKANLMIKSEYFKLVNRNESKLQLKSNSQLDIESPKVDLDLAESANSLITIKTDSLNINLKKNALAKLNGSSLYTNISTKNNSDLKAKDFSSELIEVFTKDNSNCEIKAVEKIVIEAVDKSKIELYGDPKIELNEFRGTAKLYKKEEKKKK